MDPNGTWLCPTEADRARMLEAGDRVRAARTVAASAIGLALLLGAPEVGWWTLGLLGIGALELLSLDRRMARSAKPEWLAARASLVMLLLLAVGVALDHGTYSSGLPWMIIPVALSATRFRWQVVLVGAVITIAAMFAATLPFDPNLTIDDLMPLVGAIVLLVAVVAIVLALAGGELTQRSRAILDPLTGLLNRSALDSRVEELELQARLTGAGVSLVLCDIDHFKHVNDTHGHERGDAVLKDVAYEVRKSLRSFELAYRIGGEEFLVILPGMDLDGAAEIAQRIRRNVALACPGGIDLTLSAGVACAAGADMTYEALFRSADAALFEAKREGRDRVVRASELPAMPVFDARDYTPASLS